MEGCFHIIDKNTGILPQLYFRIIYLLFFIVYHSKLVARQCWNALLFFIHAFYIPVPVAAGLTCCTFFCCSAVSQVSSATCWSPDASRGAGGHGYLLNLDLQGHWFLCSFIQHHTEILTLLFLLGMHRFAVTAWCLVKLLLFFCNFLWH